MADSVGMADIRGLDIDKTVKGFALENYTFKKSCRVSNMKGDSLRWYQETAADLTATSPSVVSNVSPLANFPTLEATWTRNTAYIKKYAAEGFISMEDRKSADIDVLARSLLRLTRAVVKQVDTRIYNVITEDGTAVNINGVTSTAAWDAASGQDPVEDILEALQDIEEYNYDTSTAELWVTPKGKKDLLTWFITSNGSNFPEWSSERMKDGALMKFLGLKVKVSNNVSDDKAVVLVPQVCATWKTHTDTTAKVIDDPGIGSKIRVWEIGECILTDPKAVTLISNTET